ncbi:MAG TPA: Hpt domain-containing protein [Rhizomicrobium sp.]|nr:Hpt domain-containing protein [Rhizomicrobium sp.]
MTQSEASVELIPADAYPPLLPMPLRAEALLTLRSAETLASANSIIALRSASLREAVHELIRQMRSAGRTASWISVYAAAHEIRGLAGTAGLSATGRIANGFCHYLDAVARQRIEPELDVVKLHLDAIARSARTEADTARHGDAVARELSELVARKLSEINESETH